MKKTKFAFILAAFLSLAFTGCQSTKNTQPAEEADSYSTPAETAEIKTASESKSKTTSTKDAKKKKKKHNIFTFGNLDKYVLTDECSVFTRNAMGGIKQQVATITVNPETEMAGYGSAYLTVYYILFLDQNSRTLIKEKYDQYVNDFQNKKLDRNGKNTYKVYDKIPVRIDWGTIKASTPNWATTDACIGYTFVEKSPYFTITIFPTENEHFKVNDTVDRLSMNLQYYFTKSQMATLLDLISEENVNAAVNEYYGTFETSDSYDDMDSYSEEEPYQEADVE